MNTQRKISIINHPVLKWKLNIAVYCRVSTTHLDQLESLSNQIECYKNMVRNHIDWVLVDIYADIQCGKNSSGRPEFQRMLEDCRNKKIDLIITKSVSRFGRNTADILAVIHKLHLLNIDVFFEVENIRSSETSKTFLLSILEAVAQAESEARSQNIKWGIRRGFESGTSKFYNRKCYGYCHDLEGNIIINKQEAVVVKKIFSLYLNGFSTLAIIRELNKEGIKLPTGKESWPKRTIDTILSNEKYIGNVIVGRSYSKDYPYNDRKVNKGEYHKYQAINNHPPLISKCQFPFRLICNESSDIFSNLHTSTSPFSNVGISYNMNFSRRSQISTPLIWICRWYNGYLSWIQGKFSFLPIISVLLCSL